MVEKQVRYRMDVTKVSPSIKVLTNKESSLEQFTSFKNVLPSHYLDTTISKKEFSTPKYEVKDCENRNILSENNLGLSETISVTFPSCEQTHDGTKYAFDSVPLFRRDLIQSNSYSAAVFPTIEGTNSCKKESFGNSVIWVPRSRKEWDDCSAELAGLCASAAQRRARALKRNLPAPLPEIYIKDRIDIDDPLRGFQIRHKTGGWLQGFILSTTFTTWTHYFRWDSRHPKSGMAPTSLPTHKTKWDDGTLSAELESQPRSGDPVGGVVWSSIAEISLLGGLGCGEYLLRMALDDISRLGCYKFVVLQATEFSRPFYEKFGFKRVGCVTRYGTHPHIVGYRHWTYADEKNLVAHGGPSYMMAIRVKDANIKSPVDERQSILEYVIKFKVNEKPATLPLAIIPKSCEISYVRNLSGKKRKDDGTRMSDNHNGLVRVVSYCNEFDKENVFKSGNSVHSIFLGQSCQKRMKMSDADNSKSRHEITNFHVKAQCNEEAKEKNRRKPPRIRENNNPSRNMVIKRISMDTLLPKSDNNFLRKQKFTISQRVRNKPIFYNKVVAKKNIQRTTNSFFFVIHFNSEAGTLRLVKLEPKGRFFKGKREGRVKWKAVLDEKKGIMCGDNQYDWTVPCTDWEIAQSVMVTKTTVVADESWDIVETNIVMQ